MKIGLAYNAIRLVDGSVPEEQREFDSIETILAIRSAIETGGYPVVQIEADADFADNLRKARPDFVFNIAEGTCGESREAHIPAILEQQGILYSGSGVLTMATTLDKSWTSARLAQCGVPVPKSWLVSKRRAHDQCSSKIGDIEVAINGGLLSAGAMLEEVRYPLMVKPNCEGSSKGITNDSLVKDKAALEAQMRKLLPVYSHVLVEQYLEGREFTVALIGNSPPRVLPLIEVLFDHLPEGLHPIDSYDVKWIYDSPESEVDSVICPAKIDETLAATIECIACRAYEALGCADFCRMDMRLDKHSIPKVIDVNALPGLIPDPKENSRFPKACYTAGMNYDQIILTVLYEAMLRYGVVPSAKHEEIVKGAKTKEANP